MTTVRTMIAVATSRSWTISQMDVKNAFLHGDLHEEVYMHPPLGVDAPPGYVCHLRRALYGLKQAPHAWFERFVSVITTAGFSPSPHDPALFTHISSRGRTLLLLYVDDMLITGDDAEHVSLIKRHLSQQFQMTDLVHSVISWALRFCILNRGIIFLNLSTFKIFLSDLVLLIIK